MSTSQESSGTPCGCSTNIAGGALCEERTGFPGSYCLAERQAEERAADERKEASAGLDPFYQVHVQVYSNDVLKGCKPFPTLSDAREFSFARRREGFGTTMIATKDGRPVPISLLPAEVLK